MCGRPAALCRLYTGILMSIGMNVDSQALLMLLLLR